MHIHFTVYGTPVAQGSTRAFIPKGWKRPVITAASKKQLPWRQEVTRTAIEAAKENGGEIIPRGQAVTIRMVFYLARPASKPKRIKRPTVKPDWDKLARSICDSLTGIVFEDDAQICDAIVSKHYGTPERVEIDIAAFDDSVQITSEASAPLNLFAETERRVSE